MYCFLFISSIDSDRRAASRTQFNDDIDLVSTTVFQAMFGTEMQFAGIANKRQKISLIARGQRTMFAVFGVGTRSGRHY